MSQFLITRFGYGDEKRGYGMDRIYKKGLGYAIEEARGGNYCFSLEEMLNRIEEGGYYIKSVMHVPSAKIYTVGDLVNGVTIESFTLDDNADSGISVNLSQDIDGYPDCCLGFLSKPSFFNDYKYLLLL